MNPSHLREFQGNVQEAKKKLGPSSCIGCPWLCYWHSRYLRGSYCIVPPALIHAWELICSIVYSQDLPHLCLTVKGDLKITDYCPKTSQHVNCTHAISFISALDIVIKSQIDSLISLFSQLIRLLHPYCQNVSSSKFSSHWPDSLCCSREHRACRDLKSHLTSFLTCFFWYEIQITHALGEEQAIAWAGFFTNSTEFMWGGTSRVALSQ